MPQDGKHKHQNATESRSLSKHSLTKGLHSCSFSTPICTQNSSCALPPPYCWFWIPIHVFVLRSLWGNRQGRGRVRKWFKVRERSNYDCDWDLLCLEEASDILSFKRMSAFWFRFTLCLLLSPFSLSLSVWFCHPLPKQRLTALSHLWNWDLWNFSLEKSICRQKLA